MQNRHIYDLNLQKWQNFLGNFERLTVYQPMQIQAESVILLTLQPKVYVYELHCEQIPSLLSPNCPYKWDVPNPFAGRKRRRRWRRKNQCGESTTVSFRYVSSHDEGSINSYVYQLILIHVQAYYFWYYILVLYCLCIKFKSFTQAFTIPIVLTASRKNVYEKKAKNVAIE